MCDFQINICGVVEVGEHLKGKTPKTIKTSYMNILKEYL